MEETNSLISTEKFLGIIENFLDFLNRNVNSWSELNLRSEEGLVKLDRDSSIEIERDGFYLTGNYKLTYRFLKEKPIRVTIRYNISGSNIGVVCKGVFEGYSIIEDDESGNVYQERFFGHDIAGLKVELGFLRDELKKRRGLELKVK